MKRYKSHFKEEDSLSNLTDVSLVDKIVNFIRDNPFPKDEALHKFADDNDIEADMMEQYVYAILTLVLAGGASKGKEVEASKENMDIGHKIEIEHFEYDTDNKVIKKMQEVLIHKIAIDHLTETNTYYVDGADFKNELETEDK